MVVDADGTGGSGGNVPTTGVVSPSGVVSVSTGGGSLCEQTCSNLAAKGCDTGGSCVADCQQTYAVAPQCASLLDTFFVCALNSSAPGCDSPPSCAGEAQAFEDCVTNIVPVTCGDIACAGNNGGSCGCKGVCDNRSLAVECMAGNATDFCTCYEDGVSVGECTMPQTGTPMTCDILEGCCAGVFFP